MKFFAFLLLVTLVNLSVTNGQETGCRKWKEDKATDLLDIFGHWYTYLADKFFAKTNDECSEYTFVWNSTFKSVDLLNTQHYKDNTATKAIKGRAHKTPSPGVFDVVYENGLILVINVVAMNEDYIIFAGCFKDKGNDWIFFNIIFGSNFYFCFS